MKRQLSILLIFVAAAAVSCNKAYIFPDTFSPPYPTLDFTLSRRNSGDTALSDIRGKSKLVLIYFGFTGCAAICPAALSKLTVVLNALSGAERQNLAVIFITVDPKRDTIERMSQYTVKFHPDIIGLTGSADEIETLLKSFGIAGIREPDGNIVHTTGVFWMKSDTGEITKRVPDSYVPEDLLLDVRLALE